MFPKFRFSDQRKTPQWKQALGLTKKELADHNCELLKEISLYVGCASHLLPELLSYLSAEIPETRFQILQNYNNMSQNDVDLKIVASSTPLAGNHRTLLLEEPILLAVPLDSPLASVPVLYAHDLTQVHFLMLGKNWSLGNYLSQYFDQVHFVPNTAMVLDNPSLMREFLRSGYGLAFVPEITWGTSFYKDTMLLRAVSDMPMKRYVYLEWQPDIYLPKSLKTCISAIKAYFSSKQASARSIK